MTTKFEYLPENSEELTELRTKIDTLINSDATPLFTARLEVNAEPGSEEDAADAALSALSRIVPPLSRAWYRIRGGVDIRVQQNAGGATSTLELLPY